MTVSIEPVLPGQTERVAFIRDYIVEHWRISRRKAERTYLNVSRGAGLPKAWVAVRPSGEIVGNALLVVEPEGFCGANRVPWLQALRVKEEWRGRGIGRDLVSRVEYHAARLGYGYLYLDTIDAAPYYEKLGGWEHVGVDYWWQRGMRVAVMRKRLTRIA